MIVVDVGIPIGVKAQAKQEVFPRDMVDKNSLEPSAVKPIPILAVIIECASANRSRPTKIDEPNTALRPLNVKAHSHIDALIEVWI